MRNRVMQDLRYVNINGKLMPLSEASLPVHSSAFRYGYGLFETMFVHNGGIRLGAYHWQRLEEGMQALELFFPAHITLQSIEDQVIRTVQKNNPGGSGRIRLQVHTPADGLYDEPHPAQFLIESYQIDGIITGLNENGLVIGTYDGAYKAKDKIANYKTSNALIYALAARTAKARHWNDALILNTSGNIIESTIANIFWISNGVIHTPPLSEGCIAGVMRRHLLQILPACGYLLTEQPLSPAILRQAEEVFITNSIRGIKWVKEWNGDAYSNSMTRELSLKVIL